MKAKFVILFVLMSIPFLTFAGEVYGTLKKDGKPVAAQLIKITQNGKLIESTKTDDKGYFSVTIKAVGAFKLEVDGYDGAVFDVFSTNNSTAYTLSLIKVGDKWQLKKQ